MHQRVAPCLLARLVAGDLRCLVLVCIWSSTIISHGFAYYISHFCYCCCCCIVFVFFIVLAVVVVVVVVVVVIADMVSAVIVVVHKIL